MEQELHASQPCDYRQFDRVWQRVSPGLEPYPGLRQTVPPAQQPVAPLPPLHTVPPAQQPVAPLPPLHTVPPAQQPVTLLPPLHTVPPAQQPVAPLPPLHTVPPAQQPVTPLPPLHTVPPAQQPVIPLPPLQGVPPTELPGAIMNPCCMGTAAAEMLQVLVGFIEEELADQRYYSAAARQGPAWARQRLREIQTDEGTHARRLMTAYYLITGECYQPAISCARIRIGPWCAALRERYHMEACNALNYARAAEGTTDPCLSKLLEELSKEEYQHSTELMLLLERSLQS